MIVTIIKPSRDVLETLGACIWKSHYAMKKKVWLINHQELCKPQ